MTMQQHREITRPIGCFQLTGRRSDGADMEKKGRPGSEQYATIDERRKSGQTEDTEMTGDDSPPSDVDYNLSTQGESGEPEGPRGGVGDGEAVSPEPESGEVFNY